MVPPQGRSMRAQPMKKMPRPLLSCASPGSSEQGAMAIDQWASWMGGTRGMKWTCMQRTGGACCVLWVQVCLPSNGRSSLSTHILLHCSGVSDLCDLGAKAFGSRTGPAVEPCFPLGAPPACASASFGTKLREDPRRAQDGRLPAGLIVALTAPWASPAMLPAGGAHHARQQQQPQQLQPGLRLQGLPPFNGRLLRVLDSFSGVSSAASGVLRAGFGLEVGATQCWVCAAGGVYFWEWVLVLGGHATPGWLAAEGLVRSVTLLGGTETRLQRLMRVCLNSCRGPAALHRGRGGATRSRHSGPPPATATRQVHGGGVGRPAGARRLCRGLHSAAPGRGAAQRGGHQVGVAGICLAWNPGQLVADSLISRGLLLNEWL